MNGQLESKLVELIEKTVQSLEATTSFFSAQLPEYVHQLLTWNLIYYSLKAAAALTFTVVAAKMISQHCGKGEVIESDSDSGETRKETLTHDSEGDLHAGSLVVLVVAVVLLIVLLKTFNLVWLQILIAPKVWLLEYANLIK